jgi:hypothetical protein
MARCTSAILRSGDATFLGWAGMDHVVVRVRFRPNPDARNNSLPTWYHRKKEDIDPSETQHFLNISRNAVLLIQSS